jgi:hypothetical protein
MIPKQILLLLILLLLPLTILAHSAENNSNDKVYYEVITRDGTRTIGALVSEDENSISLDVEGVGVISIRRDNITSITELDPTVFRDGRYWYPNPNATRYLFAPNALPVGKKVGYYQNTWIFFNNFNYGITDRFSMGAGFVPIFLFGVSALPVWVLPKYSLPLGTDNLHVSAGAMLGGVIGEGGTGVGLVYSSLTYGSRNSNLSAGIGFGYQGDGFSDSPAINISGIRRISQKYYIITENYLFSTSNGFETLGSLGVRYAPESFSVDFAIIRPGDVGGGFIGIPWLGVTIPFNRN